MNLLHEKQGSSVTGAVVKASVEGNEGREMTGQIT